MAVRLDVGTSGMSVWFSDDLGETWERPYSESGLYLEARVWALSRHPAEPGRIYAGTDSGIYRWESEAAKWNHLPSPMDGLCTWALAQAPGDPRVLVAGTHPAALYRSDDGGANWRRLPAEFARECIFIGSPRVTQLLFDPASDDIIWCGVEIDGVYRSTDGGESWQRRTEGLRSDDIHGLALTGGGNGARRAFATTNKGLHVSEDDGLTWRFQELDSPWQYTRTIQPRADGGALFLTNGNGPPGSTGRLLRSRDNGDSWEDAGLPGGLNSTPWCIATHPADPMLIFTVTNLGQLFRSSDGGESWTRLAREFGEVRSMAWQPG